jgi:hypothetical protein
MYIFMRLTKFHKYYFDLVLCSYNFTSTLFIHLFSHSIKKLFFIILKVIWKEEVNLNNSLSIAMKESLIIGIIDS